MKLSPEETEIKWFTHYTCCCSENSAHECKCTFDGMVEVVGNRFGDRRTGGVKGSDYCPWCETNFDF